MSFAGRVMLLGYDDTGGGTYVTVAGLQNTQITVNSAIVDVTTKDSAGIRQLLSDATLISHTVTGDGVFQDSAVLELIRDAARAGSPKAFKVTIPGDATSGGSYTGQFKITSFQESGAHLGEQRYSITLESAGTITWTAAS